MQLNLTPHADAPDTDRYELLSPRFKKSLRRKKSREREKENAKPSLVHCLKRKKERKGEERERGVKERKEKEERRKVKR